MFKILLPEAIIRVRFLLPEEGGRKSNIIIKWISGMQTGYGCPMRICGDLHDFRTLISKDTTYTLGDTYDLYVKFLYPELVLSKLCEGLEIELWEGKTIAHGIVLEIMRDRGREG